MNIELIKELSDKAKNKVPAGILSVELWIDHYNLILAQLILDQCIEICERGTTTQTTSSGVATLIKQHFGMSND